MMKRVVILLSIVVLVGLPALGTVACRQTSTGEALAQDGLNSLVSAAATAAAAEIPKDGAASSEVAARDGAAFTLATTVAEGKITYIGVGGPIDGLINPDLVVKPGTLVQVTLINGDGMQHDISFPDFAVTSSPVLRLGDFTLLTFVVDGEQAGAFPYYCTVPGHRQAGQEGRLVVRDGAIAATSRVD